MILLNPFHYKKYYALQVNKSMIFVWFCSDMNFYTKLVIILMKYLDSPTRNALPPPVAFL